MCDPISAGIALAVGTGATLYGSAQQSSAARANAQAIADQNQRNLMAQNEGFTARNQAALQQAASQQQVSNETLGARESSFEQTRRGQQEAQQNYYDMQIGRAT